ncbi:MAG: PleD family two-component system response regulator [Alphaproteobacteria bacterium]|jgi:two-component system cell cycle response regulator|nr:PleD family two-component system response regulator [Alphaproteobacteria bacterium]MDP6813602.1 PleD family two-component system response regulator [Alphaproteobacteria bacterium]
MSARILVVDDVLPNVKLLEAKLSREYFDVLSAMNGADALEMIHREQPDIVLLDVMMPEMDGFEVCSRIKADPDTRHIPVVMVTALSDTADRVRGLEAGADDFLTKPVNDIALFARVKSLIRLKMMMDELRLREATSNNFGVVEPEQDQMSVDGAKVLVVEDRDIYARNIQQALGDQNEVILTPDPDEALEKARSGESDLVIVSLSLQQADGLRLCSGLRSMEESRQVPILILVDDTPDQMERLVKGLDLGVNDYLIRPIDQNELLARCHTQIRRKRYEDRLRDNYHMSLAMAVTDSLTGLYNRRYLESHLENLMERAAHGDKPVGLVIMDIDHFKAVNDTHGHASGDKVLTEFATRVQRAIRGIDLGARYGGEEFVVVMPEADLEASVKIAERLRQAVEKDEFDTADEAVRIPITVSIGVSSSRGAEDSPAEILRRADEALYQAKNAGRNRVEVHESDVLQQDEPRAQAQGA